jgi:mersacidin/lichenicidin family type 2 lantibiotic
MTNDNIIRAWKDADHRRSLTKEQRARIPAHPFGAIEFQDRSFAADHAHSGGPRGCFSPCHRCFSGG